MKNKMLKFTDIQQETPVKRNTSKRKSDFNIDTKKNVIEVPIRAYEYVRAFM